MIGGVLLVMGIQLLLNAAFLAVIPLQEMAGDPFVAATAALRLSDRPARPCCASSCSSRCWPP